MDVLSEVLGWLRVEGTLSRRSEFRGTWGIAYPPVKHVSFMVVEAGSCWILQQGAPPLALSTGDLVMFSPGALTRLVDHPDTPTVPYAQVLESVAPPQQDRYAPNRVPYPTLHYGEAGPLTAFRGWGLRFDGHGQHPLLALLPPLIHFTYEQRAASPWLETTLRFLLHETHHNSDGSDMITVRLVDLLFVQVLRAWFEEQPEGQAGWLGALRDPSIGHALQLMHQYPADPWTIDGLAKTVGMSRSNFCGRFRVLVGTPPLKYLTQVRMNLAAIALTRDAHRSLSDIATNAGYDSESSFGRVFKRHHGVSPGAYRKGAGRSSDTP